MTSVSIEEPIKVDVHSKEDLYSKLREVTLCGNPSVKPYEMASIWMYGADVALELRPPQRYVLSTELDKVARVQRMIRAKTDGQIDILKLDGYLTLTYNDGTKRDILPPVVEMNTERDGDDIEPHSKIVCDGMHRCYYGYLTCQRPVSVVILSGVTRPYYAYPLNMPWSRIPMLNDSEQPGYVPEGFIKKFHRIDDYRSLYRDFNTAFNNVGASRPRTQ